MSRMSINQAMTLAIEHHRAGRLREAESIYRQILAAAGQHPGALHNLGLIARQAGDFDAALELIRAAVAQQPNYPEAHNNLGTVFAARGQMNEAIAAFSAAVKIKPDFAEAHINLGSAFKIQGQLDQAIAAYRTAIRLKPDLAEVHTALGVALAEQRQLDPAIAAHLAAIQLKPTYAEAHINLGNALKAQGQVDEAVVAYQTAIKINPSLAVAHYNLADALLKNNLDQAVEAYQTAIRLKPDFPQAYNNLGHALKAQGRLEEAIAAYRAAIELDPRGTGTHSNLIHSNVIYTMHFDPAFDPWDIRAEQERWWQMHGTKVFDVNVQHANRRDPERKLNIGYVSPDFYDQAECYFVIPLLEGHDHKRFEIHCYASVSRPDQITERERRAADVWHDVLALSDAALAEKIRGDGIDILVDLTMHMAHNRLLVFARKPAPVQVSWLAYPGSTGLPTIDYRLTDRFIDPPNADGAWSVEKPLRLPDCWCCYRAIDPPEVNELPAWTNKCLTFGSLNNPCKNNDLVFDLWARVLNAVPGSKFILLNPISEDRDRVTAVFAQRGIDSSRVECVPPMPSSEYWRTYHRIDIALDTFPYNGITTTCDALWMGVPVLTFPGKWPASRAGQGLLNAAGLAELVSATADGLVEKAAALAGDLAGLAELRRQMRGRIENSPLADGKPFAGNVEHAYRKMWRMWCGQ